MSKYSDAALRALLGLGWIVMTIRKRFRVVELLDFHGQRIPNIMVHDGHHFNVFVLLDLLLWCVLMHWLGQVLWYKVYIFIYLDPEISSTSVCSWHPMFELVQSSQSTASYSFTIWITSRHRMFYHLHTVVPMLRTNMRKSPQHRELSILASGISLHTSDSSRLTNRTIPYEVWQRDCKTRLMIQWNQRLAQPSEILSAYLIIPSVSCFDYFS